MVQDFKIMMEENHFKDCSKDEMFQLWEELRKDFHVLDFPPNSILEKKYNEIFEDEDIPSKELGVTIFIRDLYWALAEAIYQENRKDHLEWILKHSAEQYKPKPVE